MTTKTKDDAISDILVVAADLVRNDGLADPDDGCMTPHETMSLMAENKRRGRILARAVEVIRQADRESTEQEQFLAGMTAMFEMDCDAKGGQ